MSITFCLFLTIISPLIGGNVVNAVKWNTYGVGKRPCDDQGKICAHNRPDSCEGEDLVGRKIMATLQDCKISCLENSHCNALAWHSRRNHCYIKYKPDACTDTQCNWWPYNDGMNEDGWNWYWMDCEDQDISNRYKYPRSTTTTRGSNMDCPGTCYYCRSGSAGDGGKDISDEGVCEYYCSKSRYCGNGYWYKYYPESADCTKCKSSESFDPYQNTNFVEYYDQSDNEISDTTIGLRDILGPIKPVLECQDEKIWCNLANCQLDNVKISCRKTCDMC